MNNYNWSFGDGDTSVARNISHVYTFTGTGSVLLTVTHGVNATAGGGSDIKTGSVTVRNCNTQIIDPNVIDFVNLSTLIGNIGGIFPGIIALVVNIIPLYIVQGLLFFMVALFAGIVAHFGSWRL